jgi:hypothetical protein
MEKYKWLFSLESLMVISLIGNFVHFLNKKIKGETITEIKNYFVDNFKSTLVAFVATIMGGLALYFTMATGQPIDILAFFGVGYTCDSFFNKFEKP